MRKIKGFKAMNPDMSCRGFKFEVGKTYTHEGNIGLCKKGFHFCENIIDCYFHYKFKECIICEVETLTTSKIIKGNNKNVTNKIKILRKLSKKEVENLSNTGKENTGYSNSGYNNSGNKNSGSSNSGNKNSGDNNSGDNNSGYKNSGSSNSGKWNSGISNSGKWNSGDSNSGNKNSGSSNSGNNNSGDSNSGNWNSANHCSGIFNSEEQKVPLFNGAAYVLMSKFRNTKVYYILTNNNFPLTEWIPESKMTDEEKKENPNFHIMGGYLKTNSYKYACGKWWENLEDEEKELVKDIDGFNKEIFYEITGIKI